MSRLLTFAAVFVFAASCLAQEASRLEVFGGYSVENTGNNGFATNRSALNGWRLNAIDNLTRRFGIESDFSAHYGSPTLGLRGTSPLYRCSLLVCPPAAYVTGKANVHTYEIMFGPRLSLRHGKDTIFAHALFGDGHISADVFAVQSGIPSGNHSDNSFAFALGGGFGRDVGSVIGLRFYGDYLQTHFFHATQNTYRLSPGVVLRFGAKR
jgi:hypothetical protein